LSTTMSGISHEVIDILEI